LQKKRQTVAKKSDEGDDHKNKFTFSCDVCQHTWSREFEYMRHLKTFKHQKKLQIVAKKSDAVAKKSDDHNPCEKPPASEKSENIVLEITEPATPISEHRTPKKMAIIYHCRHCNFTSENKRDAQNHQKSDEHIKKEYQAEDFLEITTTYICTKCDVKYDKYKACWAHTKKCTFVKPVAAAPDERQKNEIINMEAIKTEIKKEIIEDVVVKFMENTQNNIKTFVEITNTLKDSVETIAHQPTAVGLIQNNTTTTNIIQNNCTINVFLNEKCKDAMNIFDFISNMKITFDHLYYQADNGFQKGLAKIVTDNLTAMSIYTRPIHFTDLRREIMYIKDNNEWTKHEDTEKLIEALEWAAKQGINCFVDWREATSAQDEHIDSPIGQMWMKLMQTMIRPEVDRMKAYPKIVKEIARNTHITKGDQIL